MKRKTRTPARKPTRRRRFWGRAFLEEIGPVGLSQAALAHIQELSYELLKDPEYQRWMISWSKGFLTALARGFRRKEAELKKKLKDRAAAR